MKNTNINIHNVRFYNLSPRSINNITYNRLNGKIALSRSDSSIEIWDITYAPHLEKTILCQTNNNYSLEGLCWFGERLFSGDLAGEIIEYNLKTLTRKRQQYATGNSIWCLDVNNKENCLATGTEEGYLNIFDLSDDNLLYKTVFDKQDGRILCCKFSHNGDYIVTGSLDTIRIWNTKTGHAIRKMHTGRSEKKKPTIVWSVQVLSNFTIISGDSRGQFTVWDGNNGSQIESHQVFQKDILALEINEGEDILMCAGVESLIRIYCLTPIIKNNQTLNRWVKFLQRRVHDHDVKALSFAGLKIISGGIDGFLGFSSYSKMYQEVKKYGPFLQNPCISVAKKLRLILFRYPNYLEIWKLGSSEENTTEKLLEMRSKNGEFITCSQLSSDGKWLIYSTSSAIRLFKLTYENNSLKILILKSECSNFSPSIKILFSHDSDQLYLFKNNRRLDIYDLLENDIKYNETIDYSKQIKDALHLAVTSRNDRFMALGGTCKKISVWHKHKGKWKYNTTLPKYSAPVTAIQIHPCLPKLVAVFSDGKIFEYDIIENKFINSKILLDTDFTMDSIKNILLNENEKFVLQSENKLLSCEWSASELETKTEVKKSKKDSSDSNSFSLQINLSKPYDNLIETNWLSENEIIIVGVNPVSLIEVLPNPFRQKVFGAS